MLVEIVCIFHRFLFSRTEGASRKNKFFWIYNTKCIGLFGRCKKPGFENRSAGGNPATIDKQGMTGNKIGSFTGKIDHCRNQIICYGQTS